MMGFPPVYLKLDLEDPLELVRYKFEPFEGSSDKGVGKVKKSSFYDAFYRTKKSQNTA